ncbi:MAG: bifunctional 3-demethylubiquinone-9 3-methyltransferase/ 2-octaprenyl-6-hydroxy phenol methylase [Lentisphaerae bacterium ADurb.Bin242]|nr:MAG: bifunctional 3-demethylubiquinone-9 3-methyltransferase/ 2-octaprenyl-6-hydroxy phenol methylase [Lentisphaerae bacterium ADurb.Bin242]
MNPIRTFRPCPVCGERDAENLCSLDYERFIEHLPLHYDIVSCRVCGMVFNDTTASPDDFNRYYSDCSKYDNNNIVGASNISPVERRRYGRMLELIQDSLTPEKSVIEIGCGYGGILPVLQEKGIHNITGIDPSENSVRHLLNQGIHAEVGSFEKLSDIPPCDFLIMIGVLEHIYDPLRALKNAMKLCREETVILINVPSSIDYGEYIRTPFYHFDFEHINHFSLPHMDNLLRLCGYSNRKYDYDAVRVRDVVNTTLTGTYGKTKVQEIIPDFSLSAQIKKYVDESRKNDFGKSIAALAASGKKLFLWGCGAHLARLLKSTPLSQCNIEAFIDNDPYKQTKKITGHRVLPSSTLHECGDDSTVAICSPLYRTLMTEELTRSGFKGEIVYLC